MAYANDNMEPIWISPEDGAAVALTESGGAVRHRIIAALFFAPALALLLVAASLDPDPRGLGTHDQLGLSPCGFLDQYGYPCATCGMTTSFALAADGRILAAFIAQPAGALLAVATAMVVLVSGWSLLSGATLRPVLAAVVRPRTLVVLSLVVFAAWSYKMLTYNGVH